MLRTDNICCLRIYVLELQIPLRLLRLSGSSLPLQHDSLLGNHATIDPMKLAFMSFINHSASPSSASLHKSGSNSGSKTDASACAAKIPAAMRSAAKIVHGIPLPSRKSRKATSVS